ncbi:MAG: zinc ribbon domain-containing protein [Tepidisphaeraceae bacterium]
MTEVAARQKYSCPSCGAEATWNPAKQALVCTYCGTVSPAKLADDGSLVREHDLAQALRSIPDSQRGWQAQRTMVKCQSCQAISAFDPKVVAQRCEFCGSSALVPYEEIKETITPESVLPFKLPETQVRETIRRWYATRWFAPNKLGVRALTDTVKGVYLPYWTFDARVEADWTAEAGHYYYVSESYRDAQGNVRTRQVQKIRWEPAAGSVEHFFDDELVCGSVGVGADELRHIEPYPTTELVPYDAGYVSGWLVERYQIDLSSAATTSKDRMQQQIEALCASQVPGDTHRNLHVDARYFERTFKHVLLPLWLLTYNYGRAVYHVLVNGYTGKISGKYPKSFWKIFFLVAAIVVAVVVGLLISRGR